MSERDEVTGGGEEATARARRAFERPLMPRFYKQASAAPAEGGFAVHLDGRPLRTPGKAVLVAPTEALAQAAADEWQAQGEHIDPASMPMTRLINTIVDRVAMARNETVAEIVAYAGTDLVCYRAEGPQGLVARQSEHWDPVIAWAEKSFAIRLVLAQGVMHVEQPQENMQNLRNAIENEDIVALGALASMAGLTGSAVLALAVLRGAVSAEAAWAAAHVDEDWQISQWGEDDEAARRRAFRWREMDAAARAIALTRNSVAASQV